jgi:hypothetical protein
MGKWNRKKERKGLAVEIMSKVSNLKDQKLVKASRGKGLCGLNAINNLFGVPEEYITKQQMNQEIIHVNEMNHGDPRREVESLDVIDKGFLSTFMTSHLVQKYKGHHLKRMDRCGHDLGQSFQNFETLEYAPLLPKGLYLMQIWSTTKPGHYMAIKEGMLICDKQGTKELTTENLKKFCYGDQTQMKIWNLIPIAEKPSHKDENSNTSSSSAALLVSYSSSSSSS